MAKQSAPKTKVKRPTALKRDIQNEKKRLINKSFKSKMRTSIRTFEETLTAGNVETIKEKLNEVYSLLDKAVKRNIIKINVASRKKSRLTAKAAAKTA